MFKTYTKGLTKVTVSPGLIHVEHLGNLPGQVGVKKNVDALFGEGAFDELRKGSCIEEGQGDYIYKMSVVRDMVIDFLILNVA